VDARVVAATNKDLKRLVAQQGFRANLYSRLNVVTLAVPPLAVRPGDIPLLVRHFLEKRARKRGKVIRGMSDEMMECLVNYTFPGNVRELENIMDRAVSLGTAEVLDVRDLPQELCMGRLRLIRH
jgi:two-component system response regulator HydG